MKHLLFIALATLAVQLLAQKDSSTYTYQPSTGLRTSYVAVGLLPGLKVGIERPYRVVRTDYIKPNRVRTVFKERYFVYNLAAYYQPRFHNHYMAHVDWQRNRQYPSGFFFESSLGFGVSRTLLFQDTYRQLEDDSFKKVPMAGDFYAMATIGWALGYNWGPLLHVPIKTYIRPGLMVFAPYNNFIYPRTTLDFTVVYKANRLWAAHPKLKVRVKDRTYNEPATEPATEPGE
jgi:hypothetical protein